MNTGRRFLGERVGHPHDICRIHVLLDLVDAEPAHRKCLVGGGEPATDRRAAEHKSDDPARHIFVDAAEAFHPYFDAGFLEDLRAYSLIEGFDQFEDTTGRLPALVVATPHRKDVTIIADDDSRDAGPSSTLAGHDLIRPPHSPNRTVVAQPQRAREHARARAVAV
jgi:hypothetical protein